MSWNEDSGTVSRAFEDGKWSDRENRAFLRLSSRWSERAYQEAWDEAEKATDKRFDPYRHYGDEHVDIFDDTVDGLLPHSYAWITEASVVKNAVTDFEVYLEQALRSPGHRALRRHRCTETLLCETKPFPRPGGVRRSPGRRPSRSTSF
ncbi:hypothetical protein [[Kitasatospora] papulosa]|uniref:hypothetical protein n=1 Tax=[Kitasatospora] papulosa TaxID=1464011 RepID=UPI003674BA9E